MPLQWSRYLRVRRKNGVVALFHDLHPSPLYFSDNKWKRLETCSMRVIPQKVLNELLTKKLVIKLLKKLNQPEILYLMLSQKCNFGCHYCPSKASLSQSEKCLSRKDAIAGISLWLAHLKDIVDSETDYYVIFYGGEPLLNCEVMEDVLVYLKGLREKGGLPLSRLNLMVTTNGSLVDENFLRLCREYDLLVAVGLDGPPEINDIYRPDAEGKSTYAQTVKAIKALVCHGVKTFASVTITPHNIDQLESYSQFFGELGVEKFGFNFLKGKALLEIVGVDGLDRYYKQASQAVIANAKHHGDYQMEKKVEAFNNQDFFPVDCTCYGNQLVILANGQVSNCPFAREGLGTVHGLASDFRIWNTPIVTEWRKRLPLHHPGFHHDDFKSLCGAGCAWGCRELTGDLMAIDESNRVFTQEVFDELIWSKFKS
ncbi:MAG: Radical SAM domain protein [Candidatus Woesebacteria bacterium GW2011_GWA1_39_21b]|uniref:Radical SAM domain protein n=2 Tax=Patescibacteria group TaxID=1783273 RepID=A0A0G0NDY3_9BACT|nr:MAG: Radical SAM domain protein [Candidatus Woesebacteria bacterium GW2011_GWA1_39_21b]